MDGIAMHQLAARLYPICRSITGDGLRQTLNILKELVPLEIVEVPSGTEVLDWTVPPEWNVREAWIADADGRRIVDMRNSNLHVVSYSVPVRARMSLAELRPHLHSLPDLPDRIPYRTSYYQPSWGFCLPQHQLEALTDGSYEVCIDSTLAPGALTYGELVLPGQSDDEVLLSAHVCHPSLADDNLSGVVVAAFLARELANIRRRLTLRFLFAPGTIGTVAWLARNRRRLPHIRAGLTLVCLGDSHPFTYKRTILGTAEIDRAASHVLAASGLAHDVVDYFPYGYDERQYNAPGFRIPVGSLMRGRHGQFPEYHTSADDLSFIAPQHLAESEALIASIIELLDANLKYRSLAPNGEPQLGRRGLYRALGGGDIDTQERALLWVLSLSDGEHTLLDIAERAGLDFAVVRSAARLLANHRLLDPL
jgi:aminopeptidase-like protein